jgi:hypothetical protein
MKDTKSLQSCASAISDYCFLVVGLTKNCENTIKNDVMRIQNALKAAKKILWLVVESDSEDDTVNQLKFLESSISNFKFITLGNLGNKLPRRTERIAHCRNRYAERIRMDSIYAEIDYVIVADFDGINTLISQKAIETCWTRNDWDMCAANQKGPYYDIWALRHPEWSPNDCWSQYHFMNNFSLNFEKNLSSSVYSRMITIPIDHEWIEVDSAFGGLAVYRKNAFDCCEYKGITDQNKDICEHVFFHNILKKNNAKLFINPGLINAGYTEHTTPLIWHHSLLRRIKLGIKAMAIKLLGSGYIRAS